MIAVCGVFQRSVGTWGLTGLDRLLCFMIVQHLQDFTQLLSRGLLADNNWLDFFSKLGADLQPVSGVVGGCIWGRVYSLCQGL